MHKAGFVNILGNPNVGKSTLMNALLGEQLSITTPKAQTTRHRVMGLLNSEDYQVVFSDTPGIIQPAYALQEDMMQFVTSSFDDADVFLLMVEPKPVELKDQRVLEKLQRTQTPILLLINKVDTLNQPALDKLVDFWEERLPRAEIFPISALHRFGTEPLLQRVLSLLPESPPYYPKDDISAQNERFFVAEMIREQILLLFEQEVPYAAQVEVEEFKDTDTLLRIRAIINVERSSQRAIMLGHQGKNIKRLGQRARERMEKFFGKKIFLDLHIKVRKDWRKDTDALKRWGYRQ